MNLEKLKEKATASELSLIDTVERLVREEYDILSMRKEIHTEIKNQIYDRVGEVLKTYRLVGECTRSDYRLSYRESDKLRSLMHELGDAVRLELSENND